MKIQRCVWLAALLLAACAPSGDTGYQGWVEAEQVFVSPHEPGRIETLSVREGDAVEVGAPLFTLDDELERADLNQNQASLTNARQAFERAQLLLKTASGTQKTFEDAEALLRAAEARLNSSQSPADAAESCEPGVRRRAADLFPAGRNGAGRAGRCSRCCRRTISSCASSCRKRWCRRSRSATPWLSAATAAPPTLPRA